MIAAAVAVDDDVWLISEFCAISGWIPSTANQWCCNDTSHGGCCNNDDVSFYDCIYSRNIIFLELVDRTPILLPFKSKFDLLLVFLLSAVFVVDVIVDSMSPGIAVGVPYNFSYPINCNAMMMMMIKVMVLLLVTNNEIISVSLYFKSRFHKIYAIRRTITNDATLHKNKWPS